MTRKSIWVGSSYPPDLPLVSKIFFRLIRVWPFVGKSQIQSFKTGRLKDRGDHSQDLLPRRPFQNLQLLTSWGCSCFDGCLHRPYYRLLKRGEGRVRVSENSFGSFADAWRPLLALGTLRTVPHTGFDSILHLFPWAGKLFQFPPSLLSSPVAHSPFSQTKISC